VRACESVLRPCDDPVRERDREPGARHADDDAQWDASGCGQSLGFTVTFTGRLLGGPDGGAPDGGAPDGGAPDGGAPDGGAPDAGPTDHGPPSAVVASKRVAATIGLPVILDASGSTDPDGRPMTFAWTIASRPPGAAPIMTGADTSTPTSPRWLRALRSVSHGHGQRRPERRRGRLGIRASADRRRTELRPSPERPRRLGRQRRIVRLYEGGRPDDRQLSGRPPQPVHRRR